VKNGGFFFWFCFVLFCFCVCVCVCGYWKLFTIIMQMVADFVW
jgi:hypothetical protein